MALQTSVGLRTAVVTGAGSSRGIGLATARRYAREGWPVALLDVNSAAVGKAAAAVRADYRVLALGSVPTSPRRHRCRRRRPP